MARLFDGKVAFITGASSGIGAALAEEFVRQGAKVALLARRAGRLDEVKTRIEQAGGQALAIRADVTDRASLDQAAAQTAEAFGRIDVVVANAGFGVSGPAARLETADFRRQFDTNYFGVLDTVYATLPYLRESKGRLGLVGSIMGRMNVPAYAPYCSSKFAVVSLAECFYFDLADLGIAVTAINPGIVASEIRSVNNKGEYTGKKDPVPPFLVMPTSAAARKIVRALYRRRPEIVLTKMGHLSVFVARHFPRTMRLVFRLSSKGKLDKHDQARRGKE